MKHDDSAHDQLAPQDVADHIVIHHMDSVGGLLADRDVDVDAWLADHGVESSGNLVSDLMVVLHHWAHEVECRQSDGD